MNLLVLASASPTRARILRDAGLTFEIDRPNVDEEGVKAGLRAEGLSPRDQADALAELKALAISRKRPGFVLGADQILALGKEAFDKPRGREEAAAHLRLLRGRTHSLVTAAVIAREGAPIWRFVSEPRLTMRNFTDAFIESYLDLMGDDAFASVGAYQLEGLGAQLFERTQGDWFAILGLPLLPILAFLREHGAAPQ
jgi:septum formation protein